VTATQASTFVWSHVTNAAGKKESSLKEQTKYKDEAKERIAEFSRQLRPMTIDDFKDPRLAEIMRGIVVSTIYYLYCNAHMI